MDTSPRWSILTKSLVAISMLALGGFLLFRFQVVVAPLMMAVILAYLLNPLVSAIVRRVRISRPVAVFLVYVVLVIFVLSLLGGAGLLLQQQLAGVFGTVQGLFGFLPQWIDSLSNQTISVGPYTYQIARIDLTSFQDQILNSVRDTFSRLTTLVTQAASQVAEFFGWLAFILIISYYLLHDIHALETGVLKVVPREYHKDVERLLAELGPIWNSFLRGQATLALVMGVIVGTTMSILGLRYSIAVGVFAGLMEFVPIIGPYTILITEILIAIFQPSNWMGAPPTAFVIGIAVAGIAILQIEGNFISPRIIGGQLRLHPALVIVGAFIGFSLAGIPGLLLSSPMLASMRLFARYMYAKMQDLPAWPDLEEIRPNAAHGMAVLCRPAQAADKPAILELTSHIWEGHDYIPEIWDEWLADATGVLAVAEAEGKPVGLGKLTRLAEDEWWMEGLRVHPDLQGRKVGTRLFQYLMDRWASEGAGTIRLATSAERVQIHHLCQRLSFRRVAELILLSGTALEKGDSDFQPLPLADASSALEMFDADELARGGASLANVGWKWSRLTSARIADFAQTGHAWWWKGRKGFLLLDDDLRDGKPSVDVTAAAAPLADLEEFLLHARRLTAQLGKARLAWTAPNLPTLPEKAVRAGMLREWEAAMWVYAHGPLRRPRA